MIEKDRVLSIQDNFLAEEEFIALRDVVTGEPFPWFFRPFKVTEGEDRKRDPGQLIHVIYEKGSPRSQTYDSFLSILDQLSATILYRIKINLQPRLPEPFYSGFHSDVVPEERAAQWSTSDFDEERAALWSTSILYIGSNNGYTELESTGERVESVANRLVTFPANTRHRGVSQTDEETRILINFNYLGLPS